MRQTHSLTHSLASQSMGKTNGAVVRVDDVKGMRQGNVDQWAGRCTAGTNTVHKHLVGESKEPREQGEEGEPKTIHGGSPNVIHKQQKPCSAHTDGPLPLSLCACGHSITREPLTAHRHTSVERKTTTEPMVTGLRKEVGRPWNTRCVLREVRRRFRPGCPLLAVCSLT